MMTRKYAPSTRGNGRRYLKNEDFDEEDVWSVVEEAQNSNPSSSSPKKKAGRKPKISSFSASSSHSASASSSSSSSPSCLWSVTVAPRMITTPQSEEAVNMQHLQRQSSAPVRVPDYGSCSCPRYNYDAGSWIFTNDHHHHHHHDCGYDSSDSTMMNGTVGCGSNGKYYGGDCEEEEEEEEEEEGEMVPPHEYIARRLARSQISSFSVCEGIGRTLKGRDLSKVRNAILRKTGFLE